VYSPYLDKAAPLSNKNPSSHSPFKLKQNLAFTRPELLGFIDSLLHFL